MLYVFKMWIIILSFLVATNVATQPVSNRVIEDEVYRIGLMVQAVQEALNSQDEQALKTICLYGSDSRYYSMIRGWLFQELIGVESLLHATKEEATTYKLQKNSNFLKNAIRGIDLE